MARVAQRVAPTPAPGQNLADTTTSGVRRQRASRYCHTLLMIDISNASPATPRLHHAMSALSIPQRRTGTCPM